MEGGTPAAPAGPPARRTVVGTAGHVDHGKTSLVRALTGIDCDRWQEEKDRGITIDLGFAWLREDDLQVGFVDVPGHEKFLHNALAGLGGIGLVLLVVAADEGVKPQTREHLDICRLLGIPRALVALTKADLVSEDLLELAELEVAELLADTPWADAPRFPVSSTTGEGVAELRAALVAAAGEAAEAASRAEGDEPAGADSRSDDSISDGPARDELPVRLPVDRAFHLKGLGVLVTGTLAGGRVAAGDTLEILPSGEKVRVRGIQVHSQARDEGRAGERVALQLGGVPLEEITRGMELVTPSRFALSRRLLGQFTLLPDAPKPLQGYEPVRLHVHAAEVMARMRPVGERGEPRDAGERGEPSNPGERGEARGGGEDSDSSGEGRSFRRLEPGETGLVEIRLAAPVVAVRGDRFIVRRPSPPATLGGGVILDPDYHRPRPGESVNLTRALGHGTDAALTHWVERAGEAGIGEEELARRLGREPSAVARRLAALAAAGRLLEVPAGAGHGRRFLTAAAFRRVSQRAAGVLRDYFEGHRLARGMPKAEAVERILPGAAAELSATYLSWLAARGVLTVDGDRLNLPGREAELTDGESQLAKDLVAAYAAGGLTPPSPGEMASRLGAKPQIVSGLVTYLVERGRLVRLPEGLIVAASKIEDLKTELAATGWERFTVAQFKDRFGLSRKWAIPLLEHLDSTGATRRLGDERQVVV